MVSVLALPLLFLRFFAPILTVIVVIFVPMSMLLFLFLRLIVVTVMKGRGFR